MAEACEFSSDRIQACSGYSVQTDLRKRRMKQMGLLNFIETVLCRQKTGFEKKISLNVKFGVTSFSGRSCMLWKVLYEFESPIPVESCVAGYQQLGLVLHYRDDNLIEMQHTVNGRALGTEYMAIHESSRLLNLFIQIVEFSYGLPVAMKTVSVSPVTEGSDVGGRRIGIQSTSVGMAIASTVKLPSEVGLTGVNPRFTALIYMFNAARYPTTDEEALRLYFNILEYLESPTAKRSWPPEARRLLFARNFVSHGVTLDRDKDEIKLFEQKIGKAIEPFDPQDSDHRRFIVEERQNAKTFLEARLALLL